MRYERVLLILDAWKKTFSIKTLGGGYIRHFILFTGSGVAIVETSHVDNIPPWRQEAMHETFSEGDRLSHLFWGPILSTLYNHLFELRRQGEGALRVFQSGELSLEEALEVLQELRKRTGIWSVNFREYIPHDLVELIEIDPKKVRLVRVGGRREDYFFYLPRGRFNELVEKVRSILGDTKVRVRQ